MSLRSVLSWLVVLAVAVVLCPEPVEAKPDPAAVLDTVRKLMQEKDSFAAVEYVQSLGEPPVVAGAYGKLVMDLHWKASDAAGVVAIGRAGILYSLTKAQELAKKSPEKVDAWRGHAKMIAYNVGSFTWPGWGREGYVLSEAQVRAGREAADLNLRLATELGKPPQKLSAAHWLVGAHHLSAGEDEAAIASFAEAQAQSRKAGDEEGALMGAGYEAIAKVLRGDAKAKVALDSAAAALLKRGTEDAKFYAEQLGTVLKALEAWRARK